MKWYRRFKKKYHVLHILLVTAAIFLMWWGMWGILDHLTSFSPVFYIVGVVVAFGILYLDDFHLKELE